MSDPDDIPYTDQRVLFRFSLKILALSLALFLCLPVITAQTASDSGPFGFQVSPEFADVVKALHSDNYDQALEQLTELRSIAVKSNSKLLHQEVLAAIKEVARLRREFAKVRYFHETLKEKPDDPEANEHVGIFYCVEKGDWDKGLKFLSKAGDRELRRTVQLDLKQPDDPAQQVALSDAWMSVATREKGRIRKAYQLRGRHWFLLARSELTLEERVAHDKQLQAVRLQADKIIIWNQHNGSASDRGTSECVVTLLYQGKPTWSYATQLAWEPDSPAGRVLRPPHVRFDQVRIDVTKIRGKGGGLGEVEIFDGNINVARNCAAIASGYWEQNRSYHPNKLTDGNKTGVSGFWLLNNGRKGWVTIDMVKLLQQP